MKFRSTLTLTKVPHGFYTPFNRVITTQHVSWFSPDKHFTNKSFQFHNIAYGLDLEVTDTCMHLPFTVPEECSQICTGIDLKINGYRCFQV